MTAALISGGNNRRILRWGRPRGSPRNGQQGKALHLFKCNRRILRRRLNRRLRPAVSPAGRYTPLAPCNLLSLSAKKAGCARKKRQGGEIEIPSLHPPPTDQKGATPLFGNTPAWQYVCTWQNKPKPSAAGLWGPRRAVARWGEGRARERRELSPLAEVNFSGLCEDAKVERTEP